MPSDSAAAIINPLAGAAFERLYEDQIKGELEQREAERKSAHQTLRAILAAGVALLVMESGLNFQLSESHSFVPDWRVAAATIVVVVGMAILSVYGLGAKAKRGVILALCKPLGLTYSAKGAVSRFEDFMDLRLLAEADTFKFEDYFSGAHAGCAFEMCELEQLRGYGKSERVTFRGQLMRIACPRPFSGRTVVRRHGSGGWKDLLEYPWDLEKVGLEDPRFGKIFDVYGDDQVEARAILTPVVMERLLELEKAFSGGAIRCAFARGHVLIAFEASDRFEIGDLSWTLVDRRRVESIAADIGAVFNTIDWVRRVMPA